MALDVREVQVVATEPREKIDPGRPRERREDTRRDGATNRRHPFSWVRAALGAGLARRFPASIPWAVWERSAAAAAGIQGQRVLLPLAAPVPCRVAGARSTA